MALLTTSLITRETLRVLAEKLKFLRRINRQYDSKFAVAGAKVGSTIDIRLPSNGKVRTGRIMDANTPNDRTVPLSLTDQMGVDLAFTSVDMALSIDDFRRRYLDQPIANLAAQIESSVLTRALPYVYNQIGDPTTGLTQAKALAANKVLTDNLAPVDRFLMANTAGTIQAVTDTRTLFNSQPQIRDQYEDGTMGRAAGFEWFESTVAPVHTNGAGTGYLVNGASQTGSGLIVDTGTGAIPAGTVFNIAGVFAIHPQTKVSLGTLQDFTVTTAYAGGAGTVAISPSITPTGVDQNVLASPADNAAITIEGAVSTSYGVNLAFARDFLTFATADLPLPEGKKASRFEFDGLSLRMVQDYDIVNDMFLNRVDILWGSAVLRPETAVRIANSLTA